VPQPQEPEVTNIRIENEAIALTVASHYGARVVSLIDKRTGRDWMAPGGESANTGEDAVYLSDEAVGWDECFPTVAPWDATSTAWNRRLRDHGDLWGRPWRVDSQSTISIVTTYAAAEFTFTRALALEGASVQASYSVRNEGSRPLPFMWALHGLLAVSPADRIDLPGISEVEATYLAHGDRTIRAAHLAWPGPDPAIGLALDRVHGADEQFAGKLYTSGLNAAAVGDDRGALHIAWRQDVKHLGIWFNYGGWPEAGGVHHIALEPTTAPVDHLGQAIVGGTAINLAPNDSRRWGVSLTFTGDAAGARFAA
jgi:galactose mutarotase-like enzyme